MGELNYKEAVAVRLLAPAGLNGPLGRAKRDQIYCAHRLHGIEGQHR